MFISALKNSKKTVKTFTAVASDVESNVLDSIMFIICPRVKPATFHGDPLLFTLFPRARQWSVVVETVDEKEMTVTPGCKYIKEICSHALLKCITCCTC